MRFSSLNNSVLPWRLVAEYLCIFIEAKILFLYFIYLLFKVKLKEGGLYLRVSNPSFIEKSQVWD